MINVMDNAAISNEAIQEVELLDEATLRSIEGGMGPLVVLGLRIALTFAVGAAVGVGTYLIEQL